MFPDQGPSHPREGPFLSRAGSTSTAENVVWSRGPCRRPLRHQTGGVKHPLWFLCATLLLGGRMAAQNLPPPEPAGVHALDFWVGEWEVFLASGPRDGDNRIENLLGGFALQENWTELDGHEGKSWFYYYRPEKRWKQVWVTDGGFVKEKVQVDGAPAGSVRFRGEIPLKDGGTLLDRTTLTPLADGRIRQVIEQSRDHGVTWQTGFDAYYVRKARKP